MVANVKNSSSRPSREAKGSTPNGVSASTALKLYRSMRRIRAAEQALIEEYHPADEMRCPVHFCVGQEAPPAGVCLNLVKGDYLFSGHRSHGYYLAKGGSLKGMYAEFYGKATGSNGGRAGSMEICDESANFYSGTILAGTLAIALGAALSSQLRGDGRVTVATFGDGGADEGIVYEVLNFAALKQLPMVFICENNLYSTYTRQTVRQGVCDLAGRARAFGVPSRRMYGNDVTAVWRASGRAISKARKGLGPSLLELDTYRWCGHVGPEDDDYLQYRPPEELASWMDQCPIEILKTNLSRTDILSLSKLEHVEQEIAKEIQEAFSFAKSSPFPTADELCSYVFSGQSGGDGIPVEDTPVSPFDPWQSETIPRPY